MIGWNHLVEIERIEKLSLPIFPPPHQALLPLMPYPPTESRIASRLNGSFATQSRKHRTSRPRSVLFLSGRVRIFWIYNGTRYMRDFLLKGPWLQNPELLGDLHRLCERA